MSEHKQAIADALTQALTDVGASTPAPTIEHVRHPVRSVVVPQAPALRTRNGRFSPAGICIFCNVSEAEHGKVCTKDDYAEWQRVLKDAVSKDATPVPERDYVAFRQAEGWADHGTQNAGRLSRIV